MDKLCPICGKPMAKRNKIACSYKCYATYRQHKRKCVVCGKDFYCHPSDDTKTCSRKCSTENRRRLHAQGTYDEATNKAVQARAQDPRLTRTEQHINAKEWVIQSPDGTVYRCRNLKHWLREHEHLLDGTPKQAWDGITKIKYSIQGKRKNKSRSWRGWTLLEWGK